jgi:hypothetical protein
MPNDAPPVTVTIPLISGRVKGMLGVTHLPRMWLKLRLHAAGRLPEGYRHGEGGSDGAIIEALGLDAAALLAFVADERPSELAYEAWIAAHATGLGSPAVAARNVALETAEMPEPRRSDWTARFGLPHYTIAARLNELDDWDLVHGQIVAADAPRTPLIPAISTSTTGPLGLAHLPRLWLKKLLHLYGRLPADYRHGAGGFDGMLLETFGLDNDAFDAFIATQTPGYLATEAWVREHATTLTPDAIAAFNAKLEAHVVPEERAAPRRAQLGLDDAFGGPAIRLNDVDDWAQLHEQLLAAN